ncbi:N-formylglutamate amidohydrolase [Bacillaceae bacterium IKA-2]|nr:N-formylglutamate amidohydrolase [Bacillaceae bacterium IKA-2]
MKSIERKLPIVISVPHGGLTIPKELAAKFLLTTEEVLFDCDTWERQLYNFKNDVEEYVDTDISRLVIDMNRAENDLPPENPDGVVKLLSVAKKRVWIYSEGLSQTEIATLMKRYYHPYQKRLVEASKNKKVILGLDCHTMLDVGPTPNSIEWKKRPLFCIGNRGSLTGEQLNEAITAPTQLMIKFKQLLENKFAVFIEKKIEVPMVTINQPFAGGYITKFHGNQGNIPWIQLEINRCLYLPSNTKLTTLPNQQSQTKLTEVKNLLYETFTELIIWWKTHQC